MENEDESHERAMPEKTRLKVIFELNCVDGFLPIQSGMLNAEALSENSYRLKNTPFFIEAVSYDDVSIAELALAHAAADPT